ncbi:MAG: cell wall hydrolase [Novosphingobium sp.]
MKPIIPQKQAEPPSTFAEWQQRKAARRSWQRLAHLGLAPGGRRALAALLVLAVPALAAPQIMPTFEIGDAGKAVVTIEPMPFEKSGDSFPGSAFYYLASDEQATTWAPGLGEGIHSDAEAAPGQFGALVGPAARALRIDNSGVDRSRAEQCLTAAIYYEAASEPDDGQRAVAQVILNRVAHPSYSNTVCGVVYQGSERSTGCQFSFTCDGSLARVPSRFFWERARNVAVAALSGYVYTPVGLATHYHTFAVHPYWDAKMLNVANIGAHRFFRFPGRAGEAGAFRFAYLGGEPIAAPHPHNAAADAMPDAALDPLAIERAYETGFKAAQSAGPAIGTFAPAASGYAPVRLAPPPAYAPELQKRGGEALYRAEKLPGTSTVKPEYENSGRWIARPGT